VSGFSENRLREMKLRLYKQYGHNLNKLFDHTGKFNDEEFHRGPNKIIKEAQQKKL
jgi:hypothetical protein